MLTLPRIRRGLNQQLSQGNLSLICSPMPSAAFWAAGTCAAPLGNDNLPHCLILLPPYLCACQACSRARRTCHCIRSHLHTPSASLGMGSLLTTPASRDLSLTGMRLSAG